MEGLVSVCAGLEGRHQGHRDHERHYKRAVSAQLIKEDPAGHRGSSGMGARGVSVVTHDPIIAIPMIIELVKRICATA